MAQAVIPYEIIRSRRKTLSMEINSQGKVVIRAPMGCSQRAIDEFVEAHRTWLERHYEKVQDILAERQEYRIQSGDTLMFCGEAYGVKLVSGNALRINSAEKVIYLPELPVSQLREPLKRLYQRAGGSWIRDKVRHWSRIMGIGYGTVTMSGAIKRWGSCSAKGNLNFSWLLLFAPERAVDYVVVHELAHRLEFNHSPRFWQIVEDYMPDWREQKAALTVLSETLSRQGWSAK